MKEEALTPEQIADEGKEAYLNREYLEAAASFQAACDSFLTQDNQLMAAEMQNNRCVALLQAGNLEEALDAVRGTQQVFMEGGDIRRQAMAYGNEASVLEKMKRNEEALAAYQQCADLFKEIGEHDLRVPVLKSISALQLKMGRQLESLASMDAGINEQHDRNTAERLLRRLIDIPMKWFGRS